MAGTVYEKYLTLEPDIDMGDSPTDLIQSQDDLDIDAELTEDGKLQSKIGTIFRNLKYALCFKLLCIRIYFPS